MQCTKAMYRVCETEKDAVAPMVIYHNDRKYNTVLLGNFFPWRIWPACAAHNYILSDG